MKWGYCVLAGVLLGGCVTSGKDAGLALQVEARVVSCTTDIPIEGVNMLMNIAVPDGALPQEYLHTVSDPSGAVEAQVHLQYRRRIAWRQKPLSPSADLVFEFLFDRKGFVPLHLRVPALGAREEAGLLTLELGQICLDPGGELDHLLYTHAGP